jgi:HlyD family secretion protein
MTTLDVPVIIAAPANRDSSRRPASSPRSGSFARPQAGRRGVLLACVLVIAVGTAALLWRVHPHSTVTFVTAPVTRGAVAPFVTASGTVNPVVIVQVGTYVSGVIQELRCDFNTRVTRNQLCAKIDPRPYQTVVDQDRANVDQARAQLEKDQSNLQFAKLTFDRDSELIALDSVSKQDVDTAASAYREAVSQIAVDRATVAQREAALESSQVNLGYTDIVSPVEGTVVSRNVTQGQTVAASFQTPTLFVIATDLTKMQVDTSVSESDIGEVAMGNEASFTVEAFPDRTFRGRVVQVRQAPQTVQNVVTYDVVLQVDNSQLLLKPGMTAAVRIITRHHDNVVRVPVEALRYSPPLASGAAPHAPATRAQVWVLKGSVPAAVPVQIGLDDGEYAEVAHGELGPEDRVVVSDLRAGETPSAGHPPGQIPLRAPRL